MRLGRQLLANKEINAVIILHFSYRSTPQMAYNQEYNRGPLHVGKTDLTLRAYAWSEKQIKKYVEMKKEEDIDLLSAVDGSVKAALEALGGELKRYLKEAGDEVSFTSGEKPKKDNKTGKEQHGKEKSQESSMVDPFISVAKGLGELLKPLSFGIGSHGKHEEHPQNEQVISNEKKVAEKVAQEGCYQIYKEFKKKNGMVHW